MAAWLYRLWLLSTAALLIQLAVYAPQLPERLASHFDASGNPDGYASRAEFILVWLLAIVVVNIMPLIVGVVTRKLPPRFVNTPNRDYWFATPARRERMIQIIRAMLCGAMFGANLILLLVFQYTVDQNIGDGSLPITVVWIGVALELVIALATVAWGLITLSNPADDPSLTPPS